MSSLSIDLARLDGGVLGNGLGLSDHTDLLFLTGGERAADHRAAADAAVLADDGVADDDTGLDVDVRHDDAVLHDGAGVDRAARGDDGVRDGAINFAALGDEAVLILRLAGDDARRHGVVPGIDAVALLAVEVEGGVLAQQIHIGLPQGADRADVLPVALEFIGEQAVALVQNGGDDVLAEVVLGTRVLLVLDEELFQHAPLEDVDAHGCVRALRMLRLLLEFVDGAVLAGVHDTEAAGLCQWDRAHGDGAVGLHLLVVAQHGGIVHFIDVVAGEDDDIVRMKKNPTVLILFY